MEYGLHEISICYSYVFSTVSCVALEELLLRLQYLNVTAILVASAWGDKNLLGAGL